jgi:hypothetical protein
MLRPALFLSLVLISSLAFTAPPGTPKAAPSPSRGKPAGEVKNPYVERFKQLDRNGDGYVSLDEWPLDAASFHLVDLDRDGRLSRRELLEPGTLHDAPEPFRLRRLEPGPGKPGAAPGRTQPDAGILAPQRLWSPRATPRDQVRFQFLDLNRDGRLSRSEWRGPLSTFGRIDLNRDGVITPNEWPR